jgi:hypothetical protein
VSHARWAAERSGEAPAALTARLQEIFAAHPEWEALDRPSAFASAAEWLTRGVLHREASRPVALDLLAADACVTFAFEAAADDPTTLGERAAATQVRMSQLVARAD